MTSVDTDAAILAAISLDWKKALEINNRILAGCPEDLDCLNRIGKAYLEIGDYKKAAVFFKKVLKINKYDQIAIKNLAKATQSNAPKKKSDANPGSQKSTSPFLISFLEEPGKTKVVSLVNLAPSRTLLSLNTADPVQIIIKRHSVFSYNEDGVYLGALPDDVSHRMLILIQGGNKYEAFVKSFSKNSLTVFLREISRAKKFHNTPSFASSGSDYLSFIREDSSSSEEVKQRSDTENADENDTEDSGFQKSNIHQDEEEES